MKRCLVFFLVISLIWITPIRVRANLFGPFETNINGVVFVYMGDNFPIHTTMTTGESRAFSIRIARLHAEETAVHTGRWFRGNIAVSEEFNIIIPPSGFTDVHFNIMNAAVFHSGLYTLRVITIYDDIITHTDTSRSMNLHVLQLYIPHIPPAVIPPIAPPADTPTAVTFVNVGSQWGAPVTNMVSFPVSTIGIPDGSYRISLSGLPLYLTAPNQARIHHGLFNPQLQIGNIWAATQGSYIITLTIYDAIDNIIAVSNPFLLTIFDTWR